MSGICGLFDRPFPKRIVWPGYTQNGYYKRFPLQRTEMEDDIACRSAGFSVYAVKVFSKLFEREDLGALKHQNNSFLRGTFCLRNVV